MSRFGILLGSGSSSLLRNRFNYKLKNKTTTTFTTPRPKLGLKFKSLQQSPCSASMKCIESKVSKIHFFPGFSDKYIFFFRYRKLLYFEWTSVEKEIGYPKFYETLFRSASYSKSQYKVFLSQNWILSAKIQIFQFIKVSILARKFKSVILQAFIFKSNF